MRVMSSRALVGAVLAGAALGSVPARAQIQQLPQTSRGEAQVNRLNRDIEGSQQSRSMQQQNQFETNQIRGQIQNAPSPIVVTPPPIVGSRR